MKKFLFIIFFILAFSNTVFAGEEHIEPVYGIMPDDLEDHVFFRSPNSVLMPDEQDKSRKQSDITYSFDHQGRSYKELDAENAPLFKKARLKITESIMKSSDSREEKASEKKTKKLSRNKKFSGEEQEIEKLPEIKQEGSIADSIQTQTEAGIPAIDTLALESGISEHVTEKELQLDADNINFDEETGDMVATGRPVLFIPPQNTKVIADKMLYNQDSNIIKGIGHVIVIKDNLPTTSDYFEVDMNEEMMFMTNLEAKTDVMIMNAKQGIQKDSLLTFTEGNFHSEISQIHRLSSRMVGPAFSNMILEDDEKALFFGDPSGNKLTIDIDRLFVEAGKNHDKFIAKKIRVSKNGRHYFSWPSLTAYTNKDRDYFEASYPEFGSRRKLGMFLGPGFVFGGPGGSIIKAVPFVNYAHGRFGFGGAIKYKHVYNTTELGYGSANDIFFLKGTQRLDDNLFLQYSANSFMDEWFMGARMPKYMAEVYYDKNHSIPDFLAKGRGLQFRHRAGFGLMQDNDRNYYGEKLGGNNTTTTRLRYMAQISQNIYSYKNPEEKFYFDLSVVLQGSAALYGTGDTQFVGRIGPRAHIQYKNWMQDVGYFQSAYQDHSPVPRYDAYRYGNSTAYLSEIIRLNKYISVGWSGMVNLSDDAPNGKLFQENRFMVALGPDDLKIRFGYDFVRQMTSFGFDIAFDTKGTHVNYNKLEIKNAEKLGKKEETRKQTFKPATETSEIAIASKTAKTTKPKPAVLEYAQVIEIEDPDKEITD